MNKIEFKSIVTVFVVKNLEKSLEWYKKWLGSPDNIPMENVAEYEIKKDVWLQLSEEAKNNCASSIILGVENIKDVKNDLEKCGIVTGDIFDYEVILVFDIYDLDDNRISFVQEISL